MSNDEGNDNETLVSAAERTAIKILMNATSSPLKAVLTYYLEHGHSDPRFTQVSRMLGSGDRQKAALPLIREFVDDPALRPLLTSAFSGTLDSERLKLAMQFYRSDADVDRLQKLVPLSRADVDEDRLKFTLRLLRTAPYMEDLVATQATASTWLEDERFKKAYEAGKSISAWGLDIRWRCYTLMKCAERARDVEGDFVECGVDRGGTAMCVVDYIGREAFSDRLFYLFDTYEGVVAEQMTSEETGLSKLPETRYPDVYEHVVKTYSDMPFAKVVRGRVPDTLSEFKPGPVAYLHIDMNVAMPECAALEFYWPHLSKGAPVIFDDYGFPYHSTQKTELDALAAKLGTSIMMLPTGQGLLWK